MKKLSALFVLFLAASAALAQSDTKSPQTTKPAAPAANAPKITVGPGDMTLTLENLSQEDAQTKLQGMLNRVYQVGCPVQLTSAQLTPYLMLLQSSTDTPPSQGGVDLQFRNASGKKIRSMEFDVEFLARKSIYDLKTAKIDLHLTANGTRSLDDTFDHLRHLSLPQRTYPVTLNTITLQQVTFDDGSVWMPSKENNNYCGFFSPNREMQIGAR